MRNKWYEISYGNVENQSCGGSTLFTGAYTRDFYKFKIITGY